MNTRFTASLILLVFCLAASIADDKQGKKIAGTAEDKPEQVAKSKANEVAQATVKGEFGKIVDFTYPKVVEHMGGRKKMINVMETYYKQIKERGYEMHPPRLRMPHSLLPALPKSTRLFRLRWR